VRFIFWFVIWACSLGMLEIDVLYADGLHIELHSWLGREAKHGDSE
jgi:hypothetical protein